MQVFLSWSGDRSRLVAETLSDWLSKVIQAVEPWMSVDIKKGTHWSTEIANRLGDAQVGIVCMTPENLAAPWLLFEAGAISKNTGAHVCTFLLGLSPADVQPPLGQFQHTICQRDDIRELVRTINLRVESVGEKSLPEKTLDQVFEVYWPELDTKLKAILETASTTAPTTRSDRAILEEILEILRGQENRRGRSATLMDLIRATNPEQDTGSTNNPLRPADIARYGLRDVLPGDKTSAEPIARALAQWAAREVARDSDPQ